MSAGEVAGFVRDDADHLVRRLGVDQRAGVHDHAAAARHEGVELPVLHNDDLGVARADAGGAEDRRGIVAQQLLDLGIADDRATRCVLRAPPSEAKARRRREQTARAPSPDATRKCWTSAANIRFASARFIPARCNLAQVLWARALSRVA